MAFDDLVVFNGGTEKPKNPHGLMKLGDFTFSVESVVFQTMQKKTVYNWAENQIVGKSPILQFTGEGGTVMSLEGVFYPHLSGGYQQMNRLKSMAKQGKPWSLVDGLGNSNGLWVVVDVEETRTKHNGDGLARRIDFNLSLKQYSE